MPCVPALLFSLNVFEAKVFLVNLARRQGSERWANHCDLRPGSWNLHAFCLFSISFVCVHLFFYLLSTLHLIALGLDFFN